MRAASLVLAVLLCGCTPGAQPSTVPTVAKTRDPAGLIELAIVDAVGKELGSRGILVDAGDWCPDSWKLRAVAAPEGGPLKYDASGHVRADFRGELQEIPWTATVLEFTSDRVRVRNVKATLPNP